MSMSAAVVSKLSSIVVRQPLEATAMTDGATIKLSALDFPNVPAVALFIYEHPLTNAASTIKRALSQALVHYYPFSGRFVSGGDGLSTKGAYIDCTEEGAVEFITATADCSLKQAAKLFERPATSSSGTSTGITGGTGAKNSLLDELARYYPDTGFGANDPLLSVQLTEFNCGGFILGVTSSHAIADGPGTAQFLGAIGELARGLPSPSVPPVRRDEVVLSLPAPPNPVMDVFMMNLAAHGHDMAKMREGCRLVVIDLTIPSSLISHIKLKAEFHGQPRCSSFDVAAAVLWQCRTRAILSSSSSPGDTLSVLYFLVNVRKHVGAKDGYYGNCVVIQHVAKMSSEVADADVVDLVKMIKQAKDQVRDLLLLDKNESSTTHKWAQLMDGCYSLLNINSWRNIGFEKVDFGSGPPAKVAWHAPGSPPVPLCTLCPTNRDDGGISVASVCVKEEHADAFRQELAKLNSTTS